MTENNCSIGLIRTNIQRIKPGVWFTTKNGDRYCKLPDVRDDGSPCGLIMVNPYDVQPGHYSIRNAMDNDGMPCACLVDEEIYFVESAYDLRPVNFQESVGSSVPYCTIKEA